MSDDVVLNPYSQTEDSSVSFPQGNESEQPVMDNEVNSNEPLKDNENVQLESMSENVINSPVLCPQNNISENIVCDEVQSASVVPISDKSESLVSGDIVNSPVDISNVVQNESSESPSGNSTNCSLPSKGNASEASESASTSASNPLKMRIDPLQLLNCLSILLDSSGAIKSIEEVQRVAGLMSKYSKKLVSKCIYLNILQATDTALLNEFYKDTGWSLVCAWLTEAVAALNYPLAEQILMLLKISPITVDRLKRNNIPKIVKDLSKECPHDGTKQIATIVVQQWKGLVKSCNTDIYFSSQGTSLQSPDESDNISHLSDDISLPLVNSSNQVKPISLIGKSDTDLTSQLIESNSFDLSDLEPSPKPKRGRGRGATRRPRGVTTRGRGRGRGKRGAAAKRGRGRAVTYADLLCQDIDSSDDHPDEVDDADAIPPIRIAIRNGVKVVGSKRGRRKRISRCLDDSDDEKTMDAIKEKMQTIHEDVDDDNEALKISRKKRKKKLIIDDLSDEFSEDTESNVKPVNKVEKQEVLKSPKASKAQKTKSEKLKIDDSKDKEVKLENKEKNVIISKDESEKKKREKEDTEDSRNRDKERRKESKDKYKNKDKSRKSSKDMDRERHKHKDKHKDRHRDREKENPKEKDREKEDTSKTKDKDKKKNQEEKDKATLDKVKPLSTHGLAKIPRKTASSKISLQPVSFMDALGSGDVSDKKPSTVKTKSSNGKSTGIFEESIKAPGIAGKRSVDVIKKNNTSPSVSYDAKISKITPSSTSNLADRPGGSKLISPKRHSFSEDGGGFMAAIKAADRKKIARKRKSSEEESSKNDVSSPKVSKLDIEESEGPSPTKTEKAEDKSSEVDGDTEKSPEKPVSPTDIKPTFNFYKETLPDEPEKEAESEVDSEDKPSGGIDAEPVEEEAEVEATAPEKEAEAPSANDMDIDNHDNDNGKTNPEPQVLAPTNEEYEKVHVVFTPTDNLKGVLVYHHSQNQGKKSVRWKPEEKLKELFYFPMDETERVNVNTIKFNEMMMQEKAKEREMFGKNKMMSRSSSFDYSFEDAFPDNSVQYIPFKLYPVTVPNPSSVTPGYKSMEKHVQAKREMSTMAAFFHPAMLPESPAEPDPELAPRKDPIAIPINDVTGGDSFTDNRSILWPEPLFNPPPDHPFKGPGHPQQKASQPSGRGHWVVGNATPMFPGGAGPAGNPNPVFGGLNGPQPMQVRPGVQPSPFPPSGFPPQGPGSWRGPGFSGPGEFGNPPMMMHNGPPMGMNPPGMHAIPQGPGMPPSMNMTGPGLPVNNRDNYGPRFRRDPTEVRNGLPPGGRGGFPSHRIPCRHFRNGLCRKGDSCQFLHSR